MLGTSKYLIVNEELSLDHAGDTYEKYLLSETRWYGEDVDDPQRSRLRLLVYEH
jgi:hypothetical protein